MKIFTVQVHDMILKVCSIYYIYMTALLVYTTVYMRIVHVMVMFFFTVADKPYFEQFPQDKTVFEGKKVVLSVKIDSNPPATLTWYHDNTRLNNDYTHKISSNGSLTIMTAKMSHSGTYRLVASNSEGTAENQLSLNVVAEPQIEMTECAAYSTHQPQYTTDVYEQVFTTT